MFGVVPKKIWEKTNPADEDNLIEMSCRCLLIENGNRLILIDTGFGNKQSSKFFGHYKLWGKYSLENSFDKVGFAKEEITDVFLTHPHFDHCGGAVIRESKSGLLYLHLKMLHTGFIKLNGNGQIILIQEKKLLF